MLITDDKGSMKVVAGRYALTFAKDRPFVYLDDAQGRRLAELFVLSSIHPLNGRDDTVWAGVWETSAPPTGEGPITFSLSAYSSAWERKTYRFRCWPERFSYEVEVQGQGQIADALYFGGYLSANLRWGSGFFWSGQRFLSGFNPEPNQSERSRFSPSEGSSIGLTGVPLPGRGDWFFTPPPFCFAFQGRGAWLGLGVEARPGHNRFTEYTYHARHESFHLALSFDGCTHVDGAYQLPSLGFDFAPTELDALRLHVASLHAQGYVHAPAAAAVQPGALPHAAPHASHPDWWLEPIFCGWGQQCYLAEVEKGRGPDYSRQRLYDSFLQTLEDNGVSPGIVVLDDKWQHTYGENQPDLQKWPDLPGFIRRQHTRGRKVLLWLKAWDPEGVPSTECVTNSAGAPVSVDPTNPAFEQRLRASVRRMLSPQGLDADGFKIDFTARIPSGPGLSAHGEAWGLELMKLYLGIIHDEAHRTKADALVMTHTPHPYLSDVTDMIRLNDINIEQDIPSAMGLRARVAAVACPGTLIDTDNWPMPDKAAWRRYLQLQPELGIPSLYFATHIDKTREPLDEKDYRLIRQVWSRYRRSISERSGGGAISKTPRRGRPRSGLASLMPRSWQPLWLLGLLKRKSAG